MLDILSPTDNRFRTNCHHKALKILLLFDYFKRLFGKSYRENPHSFCLLWCFWLRCFCPVSFWGSQPILFFDSLQSVSQQYVKSSAAKKTKRAWMCGVWRLLCVYNKATFATKAKQKTATGIYWVLNRAAPQTRNSLSLKRQNSHISSGRVTHNLSKFSKST